jgi:predicted O-methyltransferase YrrM
MIREPKFLSRVQGKKIRATQSDVAILDIPESLHEALRVKPDATRIKLGDLPPALDWTGAIEPIHAPESTRLFSQTNGQFFPCWLPGDKDLGEDWLVNPTYYPYYFKVFSGLSKEFSRPSLLEFGVRSGYSGLVFMKAVFGPKSYVGVDPNLYIPQGLEKSSQTFKLLQQEGHDLSFFLVEGFSSSSAVQKSLALSGPYSFIHIDGEHTYFGKLFDLWIARQLLAPGGYVLVDDLEHHGMIRDSIQVACEMGWFTKFSFVPTLRGMGVLKA